MIVLGGDDVGPAVGTVLPERQLAVLLKQVRRQNGFAPLQTHLSAHLVQAVQPQGLVKLGGVVLHLLKVVRVLGLTQKLVHKWQHLVRA